MNVVMVHTALANIDKSIERDGHPNHVALAKASQREDQAILAMRDTALSTLRSLHYAATAAVNYRTVEDPPFVAKVDPTMFLFLTAVMTTLSGWNPDRISEFSYVPANHLELISLLESTAERAILLYATAAGVTMEEAIPELVDNAAIPDDEEY